MAIWVFARLVSTAKMLIDARMAVRIFTDQTLLLASRWRYTIRPVTYAIELERSLVCHHRSSKETSVVLCNSPDFDVYPAGQWSHSHLSPTRCWWGGHGVGGGRVVGMYHGRQIQKISSNSYLNSFTLSQTHLLFTFFDPAGHFDLSTRRHSSLSGTYTFPSPQIHAGNVPSLPLSVKMNQEN